MLKSTGRYRFGYAKIRSLELDLNKRTRTTYAQLQTIRQNKDALANAIEAASIAFVYTRKEFDVGTKPRLICLIPSKSYSMPKPKNRK